MALWGERESIFFKGIFPGRLTILSVDDPTLVVYGKLKLELMGYLIKRRENTKLGGHTGDTDL